MLYLNQVMNEFHNRGQMSTNCGWWRNQ